MVPLPRWVPGKHQLAWPTVGMAEVTHSQLACTGTVFLWGLCSSHLSGTSCLGPTCPSRWRWLLFFTPPSLLGWVQSPVHTWSSLGVRSELRWQTSSCAAQWFYSVPFRLGRCGSNPSLLLLSCPAFKKLLSSLGFYFHRWRHRCLYCEDGMDSWM